MYLNMKECYYVTDYFLCPILCFSYNISRNNKMILEKSNENKYCLKWEAGKVWEDDVVCLPLYFTETCESWS